MQKEFAKYFVDPLTRENLRLEVTLEMDGKVMEGSFVSSTARYPIVQGIPRFAGHQGEQYAGSFGYQWNRWSKVQFESENRGGPMEGYTLGMWESIAGTHKDLSGKVVLDMGCGSGRFIEVAKNKGARVIGVDYSLAVEAAGENFDHDPDVCICQADALQLPIRTASMDGVFSIGVLHHTPNPEGGVQEAARILAPKGWFAISVYEKGRYYNFAIVNLWRKFFNALWPHFKHYPPLVYTYLVVYGFRPLRKIPIVGKGSRFIFPHVNLPDIRWALLDTFDSITPSFQLSHECREVFDWFKRCGFSEIEPTGWGFASFRGKKGNEGG